MSSTVEEIKALIESQGTAWEQFQRKHASDMAEVRGDLDKVMARKNRAGLFGGGDGNESLSSDGVEKLSQAIKSLYAGNENKANELFSGCVESKAGMSANDDPNGGFFVIPGFTSSIIKIAAEISPISRMARTVNISTGLRYEEPVDKDNTAPANWVGETTSRNDTTTPQLAAFGCDLNELQAMPKATQTLIDQSGRDIIGWLQGKVGDSFGLAESDAFHNGSGVAKPRGFFTYPTAATADKTRAWGTIEIVGTGASAAFPTASSSVNQGDCLQKLIGALKVQYRQGASFLMSRETGAVVSQLKDATTGRWIWTDSLVQGQPATLLGYPVELSEDMPAIGAGTLSIAFGNFSKAYTIVRRPGIRFLPDPYTDKPNVRLYAFERVGGGVHNFEALKLLSFA
jgi:HK97 family phage major capsid protein